MTRRDALAQAWETAFAGVKRAARAAEDDGAKGLYGVLFERAKAAPKRKKAPQSPSRSEHPRGGGPAAEQGTPGSRACSRGPHRARQPLGGLAHGPPMGASIDTLSPENGGTRAVRRAAARHAPAGVPACGGRTSTRVTTPLGITVKTTRPGAREAPGGLHFS